MVKLQSRVWIMWHRHWGWRARAAGLLALAALCARARVPLHCELRAELAAPPHELAARLADFNTLRAFYPHIESWRLESQWNNYTSWRYTLSFSCGARCAGDGEVRAHDEYARAPAPAHGRARAGRGALRLRTCRALPLLPWPAFCEEEEVEWAVREVGEGALYSERARARRALGAAALGWLRGGGAAGALAAERREHLRALQHAFPDVSRAT